MVHTWNTSFDRAAWIAAWADLSTYWSEKNDDWDIGKLSKQEEKFLADLPLRNISDTSSLVIARVLSNTETNIPIEAWNLYKHYAADLLFDSERPISRMGENYKWPTEF